MTTIPQKELRNSVVEVLRRADAGERFTITVPRRPVAELGPAARRSWVSGPALEAAFGDGCAADAQRGPRARSRVAGRPVRAIAREWGRLAAAVTERGGEPRRRAADLVIAATANVHDVPLLTAHTAGLALIDDLVNRS